MKNILSEKQLKDGYFSLIGGFENGKITRFVNDYDGSGICCISCTQMYDLTEKEKKRILDEWIDFFCNNPCEFKKVHFVSHVPQRLFDAVCLQTELEELRCKWGRYKDISAISKLTKLKYLFLGDCPSCEDVSPILSLEGLVSLEVHNFSKITDWSGLSRLDNLEQFIIYGTMYRRAVIDDLDFLLKMKNLSSFGGSVRSIKKYAEEEKNEISAGIKDIHWVNRTDIWNF